jgi:mannose/fructose/N-acetylgalactosamine-specific phosphotransferase system component IIB
MIYSIVLIYTISNINCYAEEIFQTEEVNVEISNIIYRNDSTIFIAYIINVKNHEKEILSTFKNLKDFALIDYRTDDLKNKSYFVIASDKILKDDIIYTNLKNCYLEKYSYYGQVMRFQEIADIIHKRNENEEFLYIKNLKK